MSIAYLHAFDFSENMEPSYNTDEEEDLKSSYILPSQNLVLVEEYYTPDSKCDRKNNAAKSYLSVCQSDRKKKKQVRTIQVLSRQICNIRNKYLLM